MKFVQNLSSGCSRIDIVCDSYFDYFAISLTMSCRAAVRLVYAVSMQLKVE